MSRATLRVLLAVLAVGTGSCSAILDFNQCTQDSDCASLARDGGVAYCTSDHICVSDVPSNVLCKPNTMVSSTDPKAVTVAGLFRTTGPSDVLDTALQDAVELGVSQINTAGGRQLIRLVECDTAGDPVQARKALTVAVKTWNAVAVVGPTSSDEVIALAQQGQDLVTQYGVLVVTPSATSPSITSLQDDNLVWRTCASDSLQAKELASLVASQSPTPTSIAVAAVNSSYGQGLASAFVSDVTMAIPTLSMTPPAPTYPEGTAGSVVANALAASSPQVALVVADQDVPDWVAALGAPPGLATTQFLLTDAALTPALFSDNPSTSVLMRITGTAPATPSGPVFNAFASAYEGAFMGMNPADTAFVANSYDAIYAIVIAMGIVQPGQKMTGEAIVAGMKQLSDPMGKPEDVGINDFADAYDRLSHGGTVNLNGTSGPIDFDPDTGDVLTAPIEVWAVDTSTTPPGFKTLQTVTP